MSPLIDADKRLFQQPFALEKQRGLIFDRLDDDGSYPRALGGKNVGQQLIAENRRLRRYAVQLFHRSTQRLPRRLAAVRVCGIAERQVKTRDSLAVII